MKTEGGARKDGELNKGARGENKTLNRNMSRVSLCPIFAVESLSLFIGRVSQTGSLSSANTGAGTDSHTTLAQVFRRAALLV